MNIERWDDLRMLLTVSRTDTITQAAQALGVDQTTVSRRLRAFEQKMGCVLVERIKGGIVLSAMGAQLVATAKRMESSVMELERRVEGEALELAGPLRLTISEIMAVAWSVPLLAFAREHPQIQLEIKATNALHSLTHREADVAVRMTTHPAEHLFGVKVGRMAVGVYAHRQWANHSLQQVPWIGWTPQDVESSLVETFRRGAHAQGPYSIWADSYMLMMRYALDGAGAVVIPCILGDATEGLVAMGDAVVLPQPLWVLTHQDLKHNPRVRALMTYLKQLCHQQADALWARHLPPR